MVDVVVVLLIGDRIVVKDGIIKELVIVLKEIQY
jgi:hypothetical protein